MQGRRDPEIGRIQIDEELRELVHGLVAEWRWIAGCALLAVGIVWLRLADSPPIYRADALLQIEEERSDFSGLTELSSALDGDDSIQAEVQIIKSRSVLLPTVEELGLTNEAKPVRFPLLGGIAARWHESSTGELADPWFGLRDWAWGGERVEIEGFELSQELEGRSLELVALGDERFRLEDPSGNSILESTVGSVAEGEGVRMVVSKLVAHAGTRFTVRKTSAIASALSLRGRLTVRERGRKTGVLELLLEGSDPEQIASTLNYIVKTYMRQDVESKSADASAMRDFLNARLPEVRSDLDLAEAALISHRSERGSVDLPLATQGLLAQLAELESGLLQLELEEAALEQRFTSEHPAMRALAEQRAELQAGLRGLKARLRTLPGSEQDSFRLVRDARLSNELYAVLQTRSQELKVLQAGTISDARVIDDAFVPGDPIGPRTKLLLCLAASVGAVVGIGIALVRRFLDVTISDTAELEAIGGLPVYACIPRSQLGASGRRFSRKTGRADELLLLRSQSDPAIEGLRSLRTSIELMLDDEVCRVLTICGVSPGVGKSFTAANLAAVVAAADTRVVLIDGDTRRGRLHQMVGQPRGPGLSELLAGTADLSHALYDTHARNLRMIPTGALPPNPSELVERQALSGLLSKLESECEFVVIDSPPLLAASESVALARVADACLMVVRSERQVRREIEAGLKRLQQGGVQLRGFVLNDVRPRGPYRDHYYAY